MALKDSLRTDLDFHLYEDEAVKVQQHLVEVIKDPAVRREVTMHAMSELDDISNTEVHVVLDALVKVFRGEALDG